MIADSVDAMATDRPYRSALTVEKIRQELIDNQGTQFDPKVVAAALRCGILDELEVRNPARVVEDSLQEILSVS